MSLPVPALIFRRVTFDMVQPNRSRCAIRPPVGEPHLGTRRQTGDRSRRETMVAHIGVGSLIDHVVGMFGAEQTRHGLDPVVEKVQSDLRRSRAEPGKPLIADLRAKPVLPGMARTGVVNADPGRGFQPRAQNILGLGDKVREVLVRQANPTIPWRDASTGNPLS